MTRNFKVSDTQVIDVRINLEPASSPRDYPRIGLYLHIDSKDSDNAFGGDGIYIEDITPPNNVIDKILKWAEKGLVQEN